MRVSASRGRGCGDISTIRRMLWRHCGWLHYLHYLGPSSVDDAVPFLLFRVQLVRSFQYLGLELSL